jgi:DNA-binding LacI/PurR family transcriptional regulator
VGVDNRKGVRLAMEHLARLGHRRIAFAGARGAHEAWDLTERFHAYRAFVAAAGLETIEEYAIQDTRMPSPHAGGEAMRRLLALDEPPTAVLFGTDEMAVGGMTVAQQAGYAIPRDIAVVGFDDSLWASYCWPPLTTLRQPARAMVERAVGALLDLVEERPVHEVGETHIFAPELVVRASTGGGAASGPG